MNDYSAWQWDVLCQRARWRGELEQGINTAEVRGSVSFVAHCIENDANNPTHTKMYVKVILLLFWDWSGSKLFTLMFTVFNFDHFHVNKKKKKNHQNYYDVLGRFNTI